MRYRARMSAGIDQDVAAIQNRLALTPDTMSVAEFVPNEHIMRLSLSFDIDQLRAAADSVIASFHDQGSGFSSKQVTMRPGATDVTQTDLSGRYWFRPDDSYEEVPREDIVDEAAYSDLHPDFSGTYLETVHAELAARFTLGRMRLLMKDSYNCNSWHRDPEPRLHIPIYSNPGSLFVVNHHCTHLPADGSVYFTDTRGYHTAMNGGEQRRLHLVAALVAVPQPL